MVIGAVNAQRRKNAEFARDAEYIREMAADDSVMERICTVENALYTSESVEEYREAAKLLENLTPEDTAVMEAEVNRILDADGDISFDEMIGL